MLLADCRQETGRIVALSFIVLLYFITIPRYLMAAELDEQLYMAGLHESAWEFSGSDFSCDLRHEVPQFGLARFRRMAGEELQFFISSFQPVPETVEGMVREVSPAWEHSPPDPIEHQITIQTGLRPMVLARKLAGWLLTSLSKGQVGSFSFTDWDDSRRRVEVQLSPVNFQKPYREFKRCLRQLPQHDGFSELQNTTLHFALDAARLDGKAERQLDRLAAYLLADDRIHRVNIDGHADDQGTKRYNVGLSARRADSVYDYLAKKGVKGEIMTRRHFGESRPKIARRTDSARAANRRVEISLHK
jgi:outer membrane protein OmpA-like peptidoglycan-associated protein